MATVTATAAVWEAEVLGECARCGGEMTIAPHVMGIELGPGIFVCHVCFYYVFDGSRSRAAQALGRGAEGDDDGPDGGPAAPAARPTLWILIGGASAPRELSPDEEREWDDFLRAVDEDRARCPMEECQTCRRPASPLIEGECLPCRGELERPTPPPGPRPTPAVLAAC
jgi:hypothetical protein